MSAVKAIRTLLVGNAPLVGLVEAAKIVAGTVQQGTVLPAIGIKHIGTVPLGAIDAQAESSLVTSRVQVTAYAKGDYGTTKKILEAVRKACNYQRGILSGVDVVSVLIDMDGPDLEYDDAIHCQSTDYMVTFHRPN